MSNPFAMTDRFIAAHGTGQVFTGGLSDVACDLTMTVEGHYRVHADIPFHARGPAATTAAATTGSSKWYSKDEPVFWLGVGDHFSMIRSGTTSGTYRVELLLPGTRA